eukprot:comp6179_c0_seq1/m.2010 comp6179_c0_seq1/g.2010  ORF comp6179_c0_seq1/g.2010 comp6179_c0_seq1/m.2010 type:complete len:277 (-) comp6179_c0_seq1:309-1139(-)
MTSAEHIEGSPTSLAHLADPEQENMTLSTLPTGARLAGLVRQAKAAFSTALPLLDLPPDMDKLLAQFGQISKQDVAATEPRWMSLGVTAAYAEIFHHPSFHLGLFYLAKGATIPLHDHPGMVVLSKVMYGNLQIRSLSWAEGTAGPGNTLRPTPLDTFDVEVRPVVYDGVVEVDSSSAPVVLQPRKGNLHTVTATTSACFLDLLAPPYDSNDGQRGCHYYQEYVQSADGPPGHLLPLDEASSLSEEIRERFVVEAEPDFVCGWVPYTGPRVNDRTP